MYHYRPSARLLYSHRQDSSNGGQVQRFPRLCHLLKRCWCWVFCQWKIRRMGWLEIAAIMLRNGYIIRGRRITHLGFRRRFPTQRLNDRPRDLRHDPHQRRQDSEYRKPNRAGPNLLVIFCLLTAGLRNTEKVFQCFLDHFGPVQQRSMLPTPSPPRQRGRTLPSYRAEQTHRQKEHLSPHQPLHSR